METIKTGNVIRLTEERARERLAKMCQEDTRTYGAELVVLIDQEWNRRHPEEKEQERQAEQ